MANDILDFVAPVEDKMQGIIKVVGVGGGGCNAVRNMYLDKVGGVTYAVMNTDSQSLSRSPVPYKIQLGAGLGAGGNPEQGKRECEESFEDIRKLLSDGTKMVFVTAGMGGGTGTGAAPLVAGIAKEMGLLTVGVVTIPFYFEKKKKIVKALKGVDEMRRNVDALLIVNNERLCDIYADSELSVKEAFKRADNILMDAVKGIAELITLPSDGGIKSDFKDVETTMKDGGGAIMAMGRASGEHRVEKAILNALDSPLLYGNDIGKAKRILFNIYSSEEGEDAKVTILATGLEDDLRSEVQKDAHSNEDDFYEDLIPKLYKPAKKEPSTMKEVLAKEQVLPFEVEKAPEPEPAPIPVPEPIVEEPKEPTIIDKWKSWLSRLAKNVAE